MDSMQIENLKLLYKIIEKSEVKNKAFLFAVESLEERKKWALIAQKTAL